MVGHISPEAQEGGLIALVEDGDEIRIDAESNTIELMIPNEEIKARRAAWKAPALKAENGALYKYAKLVSSASKGCVTDK